MARKLTSEIVDQNSLEAYETCTIIPLNKNSGVRSIGVGKVFRRIIGEIIGWVFKGDIQDVPGPLQTVTGLQGKVETAKHDMKNIFEDDETEAVILADASNSFNLLKRMFALHNVQVFCTKFSRTH